MKLIMKGLSAYRAPVPYPVLFKLMDGFLRDILKVILLSMPANLFAVDLQALEHLSGSSDVKINSVQKKNSCEPKQKSSIGLEWPEDTDFCSWDEQLNLRRMGLYRSLEGGVKALPYSENSPQAVNSVVVPVLDYDPAGNSHTSPVVIDIDAIPLEDLAVPDEPQSSVKRDDRGADRVQVEKQGQVFGCADFATFSSRGSTDYPENSLLGLEGALKEGHSGVVIDVRKLRDGVWVVHKDMDIGRTTYGRSARVPSMLSYQWEKIFLKDKNGNKTQMQAPFLENVLDSFKANASPSQVLNIEIQKGFESYSCTDLTQLDQAVSEFLEPSQYLYSSRSLEDLVCLRSEDGSGYLGLIIDPDPSSVGEKNDKGKAKTDYAFSSLMKKIIMRPKGNNENKEGKNFEEDSSHQKNNRAILDKSSYTDLHSLVGPNYGLHVDYRDFALMASKKGPVLPRIVVYRAGENGGFREMLANQANNHEVMPDGAIVDASPSSFCLRGR